MGGVTTRRAPPSIHSATLPGSLKLQLDDEVSGHARTKEALQTANTGASQSSMLDLELADYERSVQSLNRSVPPEHRFPSSSYWRCRAAAGRRFCQHGSIADTYGRPTPTPPDRVQRRAASSLTRRRSWTGSGRTTASCRGASRTKRRRRHVSRPARPR